MSVLRTAVAAAACCVLCVCAAHAADRQLSSSQEKLRKADELYRQGKEAMLVGNYSLANEYFSKAELVLSREYPEPVPQRDYPADFFYNLGLERLRRGEFKQAEEAFLRAQQMNPADAEACYNLGVLYENYLGDRKKAIEYYQRYIDLAAGAEDTVQVKSWIDALKAQEKMPWTTSN